MGSVVSIADKTETAEPRPPSRSVVVACSFVGCENTLSRSARLQHRKDHLGLCVSHRNQMRLGIPLRIVRYGRRKLCTKCKDPKKPRTAEFFGKSASSANGLRSICNDCYRLSKKTPEARARDQERWLLKGYGVTPDWFYDTLKKQGGACAICRSRDPGGRGRFCVDHDHETGAVRGLLCNHCNTALGMLRDTVSFLESAAAYLRKHGKC